MPCVLRSLIVYSLFWSAVVIQVLCFVDKRKEREDCNSPLGLQSGTIKDSQISATCHQYEVDLGGGHIADAKPRSARLNGNGAWCCQKTRRSVDLTINLEHAMNISGIATQGIEGVLDYYVKMFSVYTSIDGTNWKAVYSDLNSTNQVWNGNTDGLGTVKNMFRKLLQARYIKISPISYSYKMCLRLELYGCRKKNMTTKQNPIRTSASESLFHPTTTTAERSSTYTRHVASSLNKNLVGPTTQANVSARMEGKRQSELPMYHTYVIVAALVILVGVVLIAVFLYRRFYMNRNITGSITTCTSQTSIAGLHDCDYFRVVEVRSDDNLENQIMAV